MIDRTGRGSVWVAGAALILLLALGPAPCGADDAGRFTLEGFAILGTGAKTGDIDFEKKISGGGGIGYEIAKNFQIRADVAALKWDGEFERGGGNVGICFIIGGLRICFTGGGPVRVKQELKNTPVFVGGRYFLGDGSIRPYLEAGAGINPVTFTETVGTRVGVDKKTKVGVIPGAGIEFKFGKAVGLAAGARYYLVPKGVGDADDVEPSFFAATAALALHF